MADRTAAGGAEGDVLVGADGRARCFWGTHPAEYRDYHDHEWGREVHGDREVFERLTLEAFQSGLSWLTILRKRAAFREAFDGFDPAAIAAYGPAQRERLLADVGIVRNRAKVDATITNARALLALQERDGRDALDRLVWSARPARHVRPRSRTELPGRTTGSAGLAGRLKAAGFVFVGPTTAYAAMQALGVVDDHLVGCHVAR